MSRSDAGSVDLWTDLLEVNAVRGGRALDLGPNDGTIASLLPAYDMSVKSLDVSPISFPSPVEGAPFDLVIAPTLLDEASDTPSGERWLSGLVAPGGTLILSQRNGESLSACAGRWIRRKFGRPPGPQESTPAEASSRLCAMNLSLVQLRYHGEGPLLQRLARGFFPSRRTSARFAGVFRRPS